MLAIIKAYGIYVAILAAIGLAFGWYRSEIRAAEARGQAELMAAQAEAGWQALLDSVDVWDARKAAADSAIQGLRVKLEDQAGSARAAHDGTMQVVLAARGRIRSLVDSIESLTVEDLDVIAAAIDSSEESSRLCNQALGTCQQLVTAGDSRIWALEAEQRQSLDLNRSQALVIDRLQGLRRPSVGTVGILGWGIAGVEAVVLILQVLGG